ncbi:hypothetical protein SAMN05421821_10682 [Mucilaginibacter lappiensis]|uniref:Uncharacterized protein n=1 Tax=Mucilaginibacter lappiensis TaxID=354630 RepID=A0ABR6PKM0_9SPHI|nr:hypothetical protein [Mucilaginibacter lappiensis]MBB6110275.1 hypothetical protein [Mucilaginibacter lappiensis]SIR28783.1 hypothetical protein SAMN05421821_10682 [Mucilaginibacter lappiensis]
MKVVIISFLSFLLCQAALGQSHMISAKDAYKYINQVVIVKDDIYASKVYKDSIAVLKLGKSGNDHPLTVVLLKKPNGPALDEKVINTLQKGKASFKGLVLQNESGILMIIDNSDKIRFNFKVD